jgi:hypothetical protein
MNAASQKIKRLRSDLPLFAKTYFKIRPKSGGALVPFVFNEAQRRIHRFIEDIKKQGELVRICICKGRQQGMSSYTAARFLHKAVLFPGTAVFILAHLSDSTDYLFSMVKRMYYNLPPALQPSVSRSNRKELKFGEIDSEYALGTAGSSGIGRGTNPHLLHLSECAFYPNTDDLATGLMQGVATDPKTEIIMESTANGVNNMFYNLCMKGVDPNAMSRYKTLFIPWFIQDEYRETPPARFKPTSREQELMEIYELSLDQIYWRRRKLEDEYGGDEWKFIQEYPCVDGDAKVMTEKGLKKLRDVCVGDKTVQGTVKAVMNKGYKDCVKITTSQGYEVVCTLKHLIATPNGFEEAKNMKDKAVLLSDKPFADTVVSVEKVGEREVFDLSVPETNTFNANGIIVHNCCLSEAFVTSGNTLIKGEVLEQARKTQAYLDTLAPKILGVDGAGEGADETALVTRQGRRVVGYEVYKDPVKPMRLAGMIARKIDTEELDMVFLDVSYGYGCRDRLVEMGYGAKTMAIHFGSESLMPELYGNKRAQMYGFMKDWFEEGGVSIPDEDLFIRDLRIIPGFELTTSRGLLSLPAKDKIKKDNDGISPNIADGLALTFAFPVRAKNIKSSISVEKPDVVRARSPFKSRRLAQKFVQTKEPSEFFIK